MKVFLWKLAYRNRAVGMTIGILCALGFIWNLLDHTFIFEYYLTSCIFILIAVQIGVLINRNIDEQSSHYNK